MMDAARLHPPMLRRPETLELGQRSFAPEQADALVTLDAELARSVEGIVATTSIDALR